MNSIVCPISSEKVNKPVVRITGFLVALTVILYAYTGNVNIMILLMSDFLIRGFTKLNMSPYALLAKKTNQLLKFKPEMINKSAKLFASRVGFVFTLTSVVLYFISPLASILVALTLMAFALLEALLDFCVGCVVYTYIILPLNKKAFFQ